MTLNSMPLRNRIKDFVDSRGISRYQFCKDTGLTQNTGYRLYKDSDYIPGSDALLKICRAYKIQPGVVIEYLVEDDGNQESMVKPEPSTELMQPQASNDPDQNKHSRARSLLTVISKMQESA